MLYINTCLYLNTDAHQTHSNTLTASPYKHKVLIKTYNSAINLWWKNIMKDRNNKHKKKNIYWQKAQDEKFMF